MRESCLKCLLVPLDYEGMTVQMTKSLKPSTYRRLVRQPSFYGQSCLLKLLRFSFIISGFVLLIHSLLAKEPKFCLQRLRDGPWGIRCNYCKSCKYLHFYEGVLAGVPFLVEIHHCVCDISIKKICFISKWLYLYQLLRK